LYKTEKCVHVQQKGTLSMVAIPYDCRQNLTCSYFKTPR
jgi:hypothetical protein